MIIIAALPKVQVGGPIPLSATVVDYTHYPRLIFLALTTVFSAIGLAISSYYYLLQPLHAKKIE